MAAGAGQRAAGSSRSSSRSGGRLMAGAGSRPPGCGQSAGGTSAPVTAPRPRPRVGHGGDGSPAAVGARGWNPPPSPSLSLPSSPPRRPASGALPRSGGTPRGLPAALRAGPSGGPSDSGKGDPRPRRAQCPAPSGGASGAAPRPSPALPPPASSGTHLGSARLGPVPHGSAPRRGSAGGRRGGPGGAGRGRAAGGGPGVHARADTCKHARARGHLRAPADAPASARTRAYAGVPSAPVHTRTRTCKCRRASAHARPYVNKRKWMHTPAHTCKRTRTAPPATRTPCSSTQGTAAALAARRRTPCPHARCVCTEARTLCPNGRPTHARLPCPPPPSTCHRVRCHRPERPPCHPGATRRARPRAAAVSRARGGGRGGPRSAAAQMSGAGPGCSKQNSCAASHFPAFAAKNSKCREVPAAAVPGGGAVEGRCQGHPALVPAAAGRCWPRSVGTRTLRHGLLRCKTLPEAPRDERPGPAALGTAFPSPAVAVATHPSPGHPCAGPGPGTSPASSGGTWRGGSPQPVPAARRAPPAAAPPAEAIRRPMAAAASRKNSARAARAGQAQRGGATLPLPPPFPPPPCTSSRVTGTGGPVMGHGTGRCVPGSLLPSPGMRECIDFPPGCSSQRSFVSGPRADPSDALCLCSARGPPGDSLHCSAQLAAIGTASGSPCPAGARGARGGDLCSPRLRVLSRGEAAVGMGHAGMRAVPSARSKDGGHPCPGAVSPRAGLAPLAPGQGCGTQGPHWAQHSPHSIPHPVADEHSPSTGTRSLHGSCTFLPGLGLLRPCRLIPCHCPCRTGSSPTAPPCAGHIIPSRPPIAAAPTGPDTVQKVAADGTAAAAEARRGLIARCLHPHGSTRRGVEAPQSRRSQPHLRLPSPLLPWDGAAAAALPLSRSAAGCQAGAGAEGGPQGRIPVPNKGRSVLRAPRGTGHGADGRAGPAP